MLNVADLYKAFIWRQWKFGWVSILSLPITSLFLVCLVVYVAQVTPGILTGPTLNALLRSRSSGSSSLGLAFLQKQAPYFVAMFASWSGAMAGQRAVSDEMNRGSLEILLASPYSLSQVVTAMLCGAFTISTISWLLIGLANALLGAVLPIALHLGDFTESVGWSLANLFLQAVLCFVATEIGIALSLILPKLADSRTGMTASPAQLIGMAPALAIFISINIWPALSGERLSLIVAVFGLCAWGVGLMLIRTLCRRDYLLQV